MKYHVELSKSAEKQLAKMDKSTTKNIISWIEDNLEGCENPRLHGKPLAGNRSGEWRYRIGDYRMIADIQDDRILILILEIGHRSKIYR